MSSLMVYLNVCNSGIKKGITNSFKKVITLESVVVVVANRFNVHYTNMAEKVKKDIHSKLELILLSTSNGRES